MKPSIFALCVVFAFGGLSAQTPAWQPSPGHTQVPIWPGAVPDAQPVADPEYATTVMGDMVAGRPWVEVGNVSRPTCPACRGHRSSRLFRRIETGRWSSLRGGPRPHRDGL